MARCLLPFRLALLRSERCFASGSFVTVSPQRANCRRGHCNSAFCVIIPQQAQGASLQEPASEIPLPAVLPRTCAPAAVGLCGEMGATGFGVTHMPSALQSPAGFRDKHDSSTWSEQAGKWLLPPTTKPELGLITCFTCIPQGPGILPSSKFQQRTWQQLVMGSCFHGCQYRNHTGEMIMNKFLGSPQHPAG